MKTALSLALVIGAVGFALAQQPGNRTPQSADRTSHSVDAKFLMGARSGGQYELQASKLAVQRATDPEVKQFAQKMIDDHTKVGAELDRIAAGTTGSTTGTNPTNATDSSHSTTSRMDPVHTAMLSKLSNEQGKDFDECYIGQQVLAHEEAVMCFRKEAKKGENAQLRAFAEKNLPALREHLQLVRKICDNHIDGGHRETLKPGDNR
jgi:putative membrane protein